jgi:hypothetical protein
MPRSSVIPADGNVFFGVGAGPPPRLSRISESCTCFHLLAQRLSRSVVSTNEEVDDMSTNSSRASVTARAERKGEAPVEAVLEDGGPIGVDNKEAGDAVVYETFFDIGRKVFGNGIGVQVRTQSLVTAGSREEQDAAFDEHLDQFEAALRRNKGRLQKFLRAALREVADGSTWDPTGDDLPEPMRPAPAPAPIPVTAVPMPPTRPQVAPQAPPAVPVIRRPGT